MIWLFCGIICILVHIAEGWNINEVILCIETLNAWETSNTLIADDSKMPRCYKRVSSVSLLNGLVNVKNTNICTFVQIVLL